jgi:hypothetical protein
VLNSSLEKESSGQRPVEANSTGGEGSRRAVAPSDDDDDDKQAQNSRCQKCDMKQVSY